MADEWVTINATVRVNGHPLDLSMTVPAAPVKPSRMLPIFHQMANSFTDIGVAAAESMGRTVSCKAGCGACCRQPVPISEIEAYQLAELVDAMEEPRRTRIREKFERARSHFESTTWLERFRSEYLAVKRSAEEMQRALKLAHEYFETGIECPFLENESCSIHQQRPVSCREYLVTSSPEHCAKLDGKGIEMVELPVKPSKALKSLGRTPPGAAAGQLLLIQALKFAEVNEETNEMKTGDEWMKAFFGVAQEADQPSRPSPKPTAPSRKKRWKKR